MGLTAKLTGLQAAFASLMLGAVLVPVWVSEQRYLRSQEDLRQSAEVERFGRACGEALQRGDESAPLAYLKTMILVAPPGSIAYAAYLGADGRVLLHTDFVHGDRRLKGAKTSSEGVARAVESPQGLRQRGGTPPGEPELVSAPVYAGSPPKRVGTALIAYEPGWLASSLAKLRRDSVSRVAWVALPGLGVGLVLAVVLGRALTGPVRRLAEGARRIGEGKLDTRIEHAGADELGELAREFNAMAARLGELDELKDAFLSQITHDLRNPLSAILAYVSLMRTGAQGPVTEAQLKSLGVMEESSLYLNELIGNILELSRLEAGRLQLSPVPVDLAALARSVAELLKARAAEFGVAVEVSVPEGTTVHADHEALKRVLVNLASNALTFTPKGGRVTVAYAGENGADSVAVSDTGIGIPADKIGTLFKKFSQVAETRNKVRQARGTGLGLVICKQLIEAHGGTIGVESVYGQGTTFRFRLPKGPPQTRADSAAGL